MDQNKISLVKVFAVAVVVAAAAVLNLIRNKTQYNVIHFRVQIMFSTASLQGMLKINNGQGTIMNIL